MAEAEQLERELKLGAWPEFTLPALDGVVDGAVASEAGRHELDAVYFDTPALDLLARGITLRFRRGEPPGDVWTVKLPSDGAAAGLSRREITVAGRRDALPQAMRDLTRGWALGRPLRPLARMRTTRVNVALSAADGERLALVADDAVTVSRGRKVVARFRELEVELVGDAPAAILEAADERLRAAGAERVPQAPKLSRALGRAATRPWALTAQPLGSKPTLAEAAQVRLVEGAARLADAHALLVEDAPGAAAGARTAATELAARVAAFGPLLELPALGDGLAWLAAALDPVAELDALLVLAGEGPRGARALNGRVAAARARARAALLRTLRSRRYGSLLGGLARLADPPAATATGKRRVAASGAKLVRTSWRALRASDPADPLALRPGLAQLGAQLALLPDDGAAATLERVRLLEALAAGQASGLASFARLRSLARGGDGWSAGVLGGLELARAYAAREQFAAEWQELGRKAAWSWAG